MAERLDAVTARQYIDRNGETKTSWTRVGTAWATKNGWSITFDALPVPSINDKGALETRVLLMPPREDSRASKPSGSAPSFDEGNDRVPFAPEWR